MARQKLTPRKVIQKPATSRATSPKPPAPAQAAPAPATETFRSGAGVVGEVIRLSPGRPAPRVHPDASAPAQASAANGLSAGEANGTPLVESNGVQPGEETAAPPTHVIILPGNPGVIGFYADFGRLLSDRLPHDVASMTELHLLGLPGHDARALNGASTFGIADHVAHVLAYLRSPNVGTGRLVLTGHSYGFFLALQVLKALPPSAGVRASLVGLMPCAWQMGACAGALARLLLRDPLGIVSSSAWAAASAMPSAAGEFAFGTSKFPAGASACARAMMREPPAGLFRNVCALARDEMGEIGEVETFAAMRETAGRTFFFVVEGDRWCPPEAVKKLEEAFGGRATVERPREGERVEHAFVLEYAQCEKVARVVAGWLTELGRAGGEDEEMSVAA